MLDLFPYPPRPPQDAFVAAATSALDAGGHAVLESATGTGKTVCALTSAVAVARARGKRVLYLTRTNAQQRQVILEYRQLRRAPPAILEHPEGVTPGVAVALQGRTHLCPLRAEDEHVGRADGEELAVMCRDRCRAADAVAEGRTLRGRIRPCRFYQASRDEPGARLAAWLASEAPSAEELVAHAVTEGACPYITSRAVLPQAELVVAPYVYFFQPALREAFFSWCGAGPSDFIVVVDEAHNLPDFARSLATASLGSRSIELAVKEARDHGDPEVLDGVKASRFLRTVRDWIGAVVAEHVTDDADDALVAAHVADAELLSAFQVSTPRLDAGLARLDELGAAVREVRRRGGRVPRSSISAVAGFLAAWRSADESTHVRIAERVDDDPRLECYAVDASVVTRALLETAGSVHVSGTLTPLAEYRDSVGLPRDTVVAVFPSPFPRENRRVVVDPDVTTRFEDVRRDPGMWDELRAHLADVRDALAGRNVAVFVPSYDTLARVTDALGTDAFVDVRGAPQRELMARVEAFKKTRGGTLVSVMGGRLSEGVDFPDDALEAVIVVGLPFARPSARVDALVRFYDRRFGEGWAYGVRAPMVRRVLQAAGRVIRSPTDRGVIVILDRRASGLSAELPDLIATPDVAGVVRAFFEQHE